MSSKFKRLLIFSFIFGAIFLGLNHSLALAVDVGTSSVGASIALSESNPVQVATKVINILLSFLGILALAVILWGGFIWMTSNGSEEKIATARKILLNGAIGLVIILSAWGIATFILSKLISVTGDSGNGTDSCTNGANVSCGCGGSQTCNGGSWGPCLNSSCDPIIYPKLSCDGKPALAQCQADSNLCGSDYLCNSTTCLCEPKAALGASCNSTPGAGKCTADSNLCGPYLKCDSKDCICVGPPVITGLSPAGGFCANDQNRGCNSNADCLGGAKCDIATPNGAANNFITIYGYNFGTTSKLFENILTNVDFEKGALGSVPTDWTPAYQKHSSVGIVNTEYKSGKQSVKIHQDPNLEYPGFCNKTTCQDMYGCTWSVADKTCRFLGTDQAHMSGPAVYNEGETLVWGNSYNVMWAKLTYNLAPLEFKVGETYSIQFYYKGKTASVVSVMASTNLGWSGMCAHYSYYAALKPTYTWSWNGSKLTPTPPVGEDPCAPGFGKTCEDQPNYCCVNAPYQKKCYGALTLTSILASTINDWTLYSYTFQYTPEMDTWLNINGKKAIEIGMSIGYNPTGSGTDLYIDDFTVTKILNTGQVKFLGANATQTQLANFPRLLNPNCVSSWTDRQIIIAVPSGAATGPIQVKREGNILDNIDVTNNDLGPKIPDFVKNNISRPGLCQVSPTQGSLGAKVAYEGMNLKNSTAYFGQYSSAFAGINSNFLSSNLSGQALAPSILPGLTTTFVESNLLGVNQQSNAVKFIKEIDPEAGPYISSFYPTTGTAGQYVTILGGGFGNARGSRQVFFGDKEASYVFPEVCANSVWSDNQVIVKVPDGLSAGNFIIKIKLDDSTFINTDLLSPNNSFKFNPAETLKTSLCKINPTRGQIGDKVTLWGEYFGNNGTDASVVFSRLVATTSKIIKDGLADKLETIVPVDNTKTPAVAAITGPVRVVKNGLWGNELNFTVGKCKSNSECNASSPSCCPDGTYKAGSCAATLLSCYFDVPNSVYETKFNTGVNSGTSTEKFDSCLGMASFFGTCQTGQFCPNSPGKCSPFNPLVPEVLGNCGGSGSECGALDYCKNNAGVCLYNKSKDVCQSKVCQLESELKYSLTANNQTTEYKGSLSCRKYSKAVGQDIFVKQLKVNTSCPSGWLAAESGYCVSDPLIPCDPCPTNFKCVDNGAGNNLGLCESEKICTSGANCGANTNSLTKYSCFKEAKKSCDCCCEIGQDTRDCCAPLKCAGTCGSDTQDDGSGYGSCSGCSAVGTTSADHDSACNCSLASGKFCDTTKAGGVCVDCSALDASSCSLHAEQCCFDSLKNTCQGGDGTLLPGGKCAYYDCDSSDKSKCNLAATTTGQFLSTSACTTSCKNNPTSACDLAGSDAAKCSNYGTCCFDAKTNKCVDGSDKINALGINYCAYYNCNQVTKSCASSVASTTGEFLGVVKCEASCKIDPTLPGSTCASASINSCNTSFCGNPYTCKTDAGDPPVTGDCGTCCCKPGDKNGTLTCLADKGDCTGSARGLFCGCKSDTECGNIASQGCGDDTCCYGRPNVISTNPVNSQDKICRNSQIVINFDSVMDKQTLASNIILIEEKEYGKDTCPSGTTLSFNNFKPKSGNLIVRLYQNFSNSFKRLFGKVSDSAIAALPSANKLYCVSSAIVDSGLTFTAAGASSSVAYIKPQRILSPKTNYFVVIKGDENLDSNSGVISENKIGLNAAATSPIKNAAFNGVSFKNAYIFNFQTLDSNSNKNGLCVVSDVVLSPNSFLIKSADNDASDDVPGTLIFDSKDDNDRAILAQAYSIDKQLLQPISGYYWNWNWVIEDNSVVKNSNLPGLKSNQIVVSGVSGVSDKSTKVKAMINMDNFSSASSCLSSNCVCSGSDCSNKCCNATFEGDRTFGESNAYVFLCANPWPMEKAGIWNPWADKCLDASGNSIAECINYNYKFYYCRDAGNAGTVDDLPAVIDPALILGSSDLICSVGGQACAEQNAACSTGGTCIWNILKESYFFREGIPQSGEITEVKSTGAGGQIAVSWYAPISTTTPVVSFKVYYGLVSGSASSYVSPLSLTEASCNPVSGRNYCTYFVNKLIDGQKYYFKVSSVSDKKTESPLSGSKEAIPTDTTAPAKPQGLKVESLSTKIKVSWTANSDDTLFYRLFHGLFSGKIAESVDSPNNVNSLEFSQDTYRAGDHFFYLSAVDKSGNVSDKSAEFKFTK